MSESRQKLCILGSTGSIGVSTLEVAGKQSQRFEIFALGAHSNAELMLEQIRSFAPVYAVLRDEIAAARLREQVAQLDLATEVLTGGEGLVDIAAHPDVDIVMAAIVGAAGLDSSLAAARTGKRVLLANKESLVMAGDLFMQTVREHDSELLPIDSEHNAIFQCMPAGYVAGQRAAGVSRLLLTGSGGPFREWPIANLAGATVSEACAHPNWDMGAKISVDSASMMNKGLELIEACYLFNVSPDEVDIVVHPQSVIHSMVQYEDGSVLAQMGQPDMRTPIAHGLAWPQRIPSGVEPLDFMALQGLQFEAADLQRFPALGLARAAAQAGCASSCVLNAANEVAVDNFLREKIRFTDMIRISEQCLAVMDASEPSSLEEVKALDNWARDRAQHFVSSVSASVQVGP